jgi:hypothetical protein
VVTVKESAKVMVMAMETVTVTVTVTASLRTPMVMEKGELLVEREDVGQILMSLVRS